jgi:heme-degrading monooxygenase HmoA
VIPRLPSGLENPWGFLKYSLVHEPKEHPMFVRKVSMRLKSEAAAQFIHKMEDEIIPLLRKQKGFLDEMTLIAQSGKEVYAYSFWESSTDAENYDNSEFAQVTGMLAGVIEGALRIHTYMVANSTFHKMAAAVAS